VGTSRVNWGSCTEVSSMPTGNLIERTAGDEILSAVEVAQELRCSKAHVYNVILGRVEGVTPLPVIVMGRRRLIRRSSLEHWKRSNEQQFTPTGG
jgi:Helix-turn-helix domain